MDPPPRPDRGGQVALYTRRIPLPRTLLVLCSELFLALRLGPLRPVVPLSLLLVLVLVVVVLLLPLVSVRSLRLLILLLLALPFLILWPFPIDMVAVLLPGLDAVLELIVDVGVDGDIPAP